MLGSIDDWCGWAMIGIYAANMLGLVVFYAALDFDLSKPWHNSATHNFGWLKR